MNAPAGTVRFVGETVIRDSGKPDIYAPEFDYQAARADRPALQGPIISKPEKGATRPMCSFGMLSWSPEKLPLPPW